MNALVTGGTKGIGYGIARAMAAASRGVARVAVAVARGAATRVAIAQSQLPPDVNRNGITIRKQSTDFLQVIALTSPDRRYDTTFLSNYALLNIQDALARVKGVGFVRLFGARDYSMRIWLDPDKMARLGISAADVQRVVQEQNVVAPAGRIGVPPMPAGVPMQYSVTVQGRLTDATQYENIVISAATNGQIVRLKDIARIELGGADYTINVQENGVPGVFIGIFLQPDANALDTARDVSRTMETLAQRFPPSMVYSVPYSTTPFVTESMKEVVITLFEAMVLVMLVVYLFLQSWRATLIPMLVVPVSLVGTFAVFTALGFTINTLTLFGLVLAIGIVVDDAIVVVEAVQHRLDNDSLGPVEATKAALQDVGGPVVAIALVLSAVFIPVAFLGGLTGELYKQFALTLATSVILSAVAALTLAPALCALLLHPAAQHKPNPLLRGFFDWFNNTFARCTRGYVSSTAVLIRRALLVALTFAVLLVAIYGLLKTRPTALVPDEDQGYMFAVMILPPASSLERTNAVVDRFTQIAMNTPGVAGVASLPSPIGGWNARDSLANMQPLDAVQLINFFPTPTDVTLRKGYTKSSTGITGKVNSFHIYNQCE